MYTHIPSLLRPLPPPHPTPLGGHRALSWVPCVYRSFLLASYFTQGRVYVSMLLSQFIPPSPSPRVHSLFATSAQLLLPCKLGSSVPFFSRFSAVIFLSKRECGWLATILETLHLPWQPEKDLDALFSGTFPASGLSWKKALLLEVRVSCVSLSGISLTVTQGLRTGVMVLRIFKIQFLPSAAPVLLFSSPTAGLLPRNLPFIGKDLGARIMVSGHFSPPCTPGMWFWVIWLSLLCLVDF